MGFTVIVPCHHAPRRLPRKLEQEIGGNPVMVWALERAMRSGADRVLAALSDSSLEPIAKAAGAESILTGNHSSGTSRAAEAAESLGLDGTDVVIVQADEPFISPDTIDLVAETLRLNRDADCATAARPLADGQYEDPGTVKVALDSRGRALWFSRAPIPFNRDEPGSAPESARAHLGLYAYHVDFLRRYPGLAPAPAEQAESLEQLRILWHGHSIAVAETDDKSFGIDTQADLDRARALMGERPA